MENSSQLGKRVEISGYIGTIRYYGPLMHTKEPSNPEVIWLGIEWDNYNRGKNNGTVDSYHYFDCQYCLKYPNGNLYKAGSLVFNDKKVNYGISLEMALIYKYAPHSQENLDLLKLWEEELYVVTNTQNRKKIEFPGMKEIMEKFSNTQILKEIGLQKLKISFIENNLNHIIPNVQYLNLDYNLLYDWSQYFTIVKALPNLYSLSLNHNRLIKPSKSIINDKKEEELINPKLKILSLIAMELGWEDIMILSKSFKMLEELWLCQNNCSKISSLNETNELANLNSLKLLNLEENDIKSWNEISCFSILENLEKLYLGLNFIETISYFDGFQKLTAITLHGNRIKQIKQINFLDKFPILSSTRMNDNPLEMIHGKNSRIFIIAKIKKLTCLNGSTIKKQDRKDAEIYYEQKCFEDYLAFEKQNPNYDLKEFMKENHPRWNELVSIYGYPVNYTKTIESKENIVPQTSNFATVTLIPVSENAAYKLPISKRIPLNITIKAFKGMCSKIFGINVLKQKLIFIENQENAGIELNEDLRLLSFYNIKNQTTIKIQEC